ncbi:MAG: ABC transporter ATP-binding protein [Magnetococcales bacterium]|nr:ABC transporter ATP-binding protein [Magnetococcales bacterium]
MITVSDLVMEYPGHRVLDRLSFRLPQGSVTALVGVNGVGKTTLLRALAALSPPLSGEVIINGRNIRDNPRQCHRDIGYLSDFFGLYDGMSVRRCLTLTALFHGLFPPYDDAMIERLAARVHLTEHLEKPAGALSRGLRQRLGVAQAIMHRPRVMLFDEPASGLDPLARSQLAELIRSLQAEGMTLVISSHILSELEDYSTHMLNLRGPGEVILEEMNALEAGEALRYVVVQAQPDGRLAEVLTADEQATEITMQAGERVLELTLSGGDAAVAALNRRLVEQGFEICRLFEKKPDFQAAFLAQCRTNPTPGREMSS